MILADKIMCLRKKNGWSQEELANEINVSRQSVSKWENESAVPEIEKIILLSNIFNVSTDYLLREDSEEECINIGEKVPPIDAPKVLSTQEVHMYINESSKLARYRATGVSLFILAVTVFILISIAPKIPVYDISSTLALIIGFVLMIPFIVKAIISFSKGFVSKTIVKHGARDCISYLSVSDKANVEKEKMEYKKTYQSGLVYGIVLFVIGFIPIIILLMVLFLIIINIAIHILIRVSIKIRIYDMLLNSK